MTNEEIDKLIHMNERLNLILGYAMSFVFSAVRKIDCPRYKWIVNAVENLIYLDKPLPPMP